MDRVPDAAPVMTYLRTTGHFGTLASTTLLAEADAAMASPAPGTSREGAPEPDVRRQALRHIHEVLADLAAQEESAAAPAGDR